MQKKITIFLITALIIGGLSIFNFQLASVQAKVGINPGMEAPNFELLNLNDQKISLNDFRGKKVLINFWASWCPPCIEEMPDIQKLHTEYGDEIIILALNIGESKSTAASFMADNNLNFRVLLDKDKEIARNYIVRGIPTSYFLDENGVITDRIVGVLNYEKMLKLSNLEK